MSAKAPTTSDSTPTHVRPLRSLSVNRGSTKGTKGFGIGGHGEGCDDEGHVGVG
ncbi:hypothetical protein [Sinomonas atrocyanea]|uniref:hypothetical protein n=1 Tax=Sinomonas atrocyanea TaxID=37927 RepID=UPI0012EEBFCF|nr:hypothetical protein [Sinomonas atrocyanea]